MAIKITLCTAATSALAVAAVAFGVPVHASPANCAPSAPRESEAWCDDASDLPGLIHPVHMRALQQVGARFAGIWIDRSKTPARLSVGVVAPSPQDVSTIAATRHADGRVQVIPVTYSQVYLHRALVAFRKAMNASGVTYQTLGVDVTTNSLSVSGPDAAALSTTGEKAGLPQGLIRVEPLVPVQPAGDSGGAVYSLNSNGDARAAGLVAAIAAGTCYFSRIGYALGDMDATMFYG